MPRKIYSKTDYGLHSKERRIVLLIDMDHFEVQVHQKLQLPESIGLPCIVVNSSDRILSISPEAKRLGISRKGTKYFRNAVQIYPKLIRIEVPAWENGRPRTDVPQRASYEIAKLIRKFLKEHYNSSDAFFEYSSRDEFFIELTRLVDKMSHYDHRRLMLGMLNETSGIHLYDETEGEPNALNSWLQDVRCNEIERYSDRDYNIAQGLRLLVGAAIAKQIQQTIFDNLQYTCSVGVASNKLVAKIACGMNKPNGISIVTPSGFNHFTTMVKIGDIPSLGGNVGERLMKVFGINTMAELQRIGVSLLEEFFLENVHNLSNGNKKAVATLNYAAGICNKPVYSRKFIPKASYKRSLVRYQRPGFYNVNQIIPILKEQLKEMEARLLLEIEFWSRREKTIRFVLWRPGNNIRATWTRSATNPIDKQVYLEKIIKENWNGHYSKRFPIHSLEIVANF